MHILGKPVIWKVGQGKEMGATGPDWIESLASAWQQVLKKPEKHIVLDMSNIGFVTLFEWVSTVAILERLLTDGSVSSIGIDLVGSETANILSPREYLAYRRGETSLPKYRISDYISSERVYQVAGFLESLGTSDVLNRPEHNGKVLYPWVERSGVHLRSFYTTEGAKPSVVLGLTRIESKEDCKEFLDARQILHWRSAMEKRFRSSPLFESEEMWRILCHELAVNIWEHSGGSGFLGARVVSPFDEKGRIKRWCKNSFQTTIDDLWPFMKHGFLELCIADSGNGFVNTLKESYMRCSNLTSDEPLPEDVLIFAFDELGTCKEKEESWITERHALGRILYIVSKYGGVLTLRSDGVEIVYASKGGVFKKRSNNLGYKPTCVRKFRAPFPGAQIQLILPLVPIIDIKQRAERHSVLEVSLPKSFRTEDSHVHGHLIPLLEVLDEKEACIGRKDQRRFQKACEKLCDRLVQCRPSFEPLVLDFSGLNWTPAQFETFLYLLQNILQNRPSILVEIDPRLASSIVNLEEQSSGTQLYDEITPKSASITGRAFGEFAEDRYLETYSRVHATILGIDSDGRKFIFGLLDQLYEQPLLSLIDNPRSIKEVCQETYWGGEIQENILRSILNAINPLFQVASQGRWGCVWGPKELANEVTRAMSRHFDDIAARTGAWRGKDKTAKDAKPVIRKYNLSWQEEWREDFLESSRFLSRERHVDEAAQRLIYRLRRGLETIGKSLKDVKVLACITGPAMLLATAVHRWWPVESPPIIADLGYYVLLGHPKNLPAIVRDGGVVIIQDILDTQRVSGRLINLLREQSIEILCLIGLIRLRTDLTETQVTSIKDGWLPENDKKGSDFLPIHAMIEVKSPKKCEPLTDNEDDSNAFWVEPRSLHPIRYKTLRRDFPPKRDPDLFKRDKYLPQFDDDPIHGCLIAAGHYVYGRRHYSTAVNVCKTIEGPIGDMIATWLADVCEGKKRRHAESWERPEGPNFEGDVTAVLMPLHSQIHYLWPRVANLLAQRGRRQPMWLLDASLFTGRAPAYRIPAQFRYQIKKAVEDAIYASRPQTKRHPNPLRILILDDAITTARTAETILLSITQEVRNQIVFQDHTKDARKFNKQVNPIQWIRYFAVLNQMGYAQHMLWRNLRHVGAPPVPFLLDEFAPFMGVPVYDENDCPICRDRLRLENLYSKCKQCGAFTAIHWIKKYLEESVPVAIDAPGGLPQPKLLAKGIDVLTKGHRFKPRHADSAIWRFYELMYLSYPPGDVLRSLGRAWTEVSGSDSANEEIQQLERYRWAVLEWCLRNWGRVKANTARELFIDCAKREVDRNTPLVEKLLEACSQRHHDRYIKQFVHYCIKALADLEKQRHGTVHDQDRVDRMERLDIGLTSFFLNIPIEEFEIDSKKDSEQEEGPPLIKILDMTARSLDSSGPNLLGILFYRLTRPRIPDPKWALNIIAESLYRGRDTIHESVGRHHFLPRLIANRLRRQRNIEDDLLLEGSLSVFLAALEDISLYADLEGISYEPSNKLKSLGKEVLDWLRKSRESNQELQRPKALRRLGDALDLNKGQFISSFSKVFHEEVGNLEEYFLERKKEIDEHNRLNFAYRPDSNVKYDRILTLVLRLKICLANYTIDPIKDFDSKHDSLITVRSIKEGDGSEMLQFRLLTNFADFEESKRRIYQGRSWTGGRVYFEMFGVKFDGLEPPSDEEFKQGFTCAFNIKVPIGFKTRRDPA